MASEERYNDDFLDEEVDHVIPYDGPEIKFSHIIADNAGLRPYQADMKKEVYDQWDKTPNVMLQMPTGTGKTVVFTSIVKDILSWCKDNDSNAKILIIAHRKELIEQASRKLGKIPHGIIQSTHQQHLYRQVQVASIQTFVSRRNYEKMRRLNVGFIIIDEAHHSMASGYQKLWDMFPNSRKLGVTATPWRMDHSGFTSIFGALVLSKSVEWFVNKGYLSNYDYISIRRDSEIQHSINGIDKYGVDGDYKEAELSRMFDKDHIRAQLFKSYAQFVKGSKGIIYAIDRQHAANICSLYASHGVRICMIDGTTPAAERAELINDFKAGRIEVIVNVNIFSEGFDCPDIEFIQLARPTKSLTMYLQQVGRGLRISDGKERSVILDNVGLYNRFGTPMANRHWRHHFLGYDNDGDGFIDGSGIMRDIIFGDPHSPDYEEDDEEMTVVERAVGSKQVRDESADSAAALSRYNVFRQNGLYGVCDRRNRVTVPPIYEEMHPYCNGYIPFKQNGKWGIMLFDGTVKVRPKYFNIGPFIDGKAVVQNTADSEPYCINDKLERIEP